MQHSHVTRQVDCPLMEHGHVARQVDYPLMEHGHVAPHVDYPLYVKHSHVTHHAAHEEHK